MLKKIEELAPLFNKTGATSPPTVDSLSNDMKNLVQIARTSVAASVALHDVSSQLIDSLAQQIAQISVELEQVKYHQVKDKEELLSMIQQKSEGQSGFYGGPSWNQMPTAPNTIPWQQHASNPYYQGGYAEQSQPGPLDPNPQIPQPSQPGPLNPNPQMAQPSIPGPLNPNPEMGAPGAVPQTAESVPSLNPRERQNGGPLDVNTLFG